MATVRWSIADKQRLPVRRLWTDDAAITNRGFRHFDWTKFMEQKSHSRAVAALLGGSGVFAALLPSGAFAQDQELPAVSNVNGKISFGFASAGGDTDSDGLFLNGAASFPISTRLGAQVDIGGADGYVGVGLHLFLRDPDSYLFGIYTHRINYDTALGTAQNLRYGLEAEGYFGDITIAGFVGRDEVDGAAPSDSFSAVELDLDYYLTDNTMLNLSAERAFDEDAATIGVTHLYEVGATPFAVSGSVGTYDGDATGSIGITVFFGNGGKSLKDIHRQNDPRVRLGASPTRSGYFDALQAGTITGPIECTGKYCNG